MTLPSAVISITSISGDDSATVECDVISAQIHHGRDDATTQPDASTATIDALGPLPAVAVIGATVRLFAVVDGVYYPRFTGEITDLIVGWESAALAQPRIIATGYIGRLARRMVGDIPWPAELDGERATRILTLAGYTPDPFYTDKGTLTVLPRDVDRQPALTLLHDVASDGGGILWEDVQGRVLYADAAHRRSARLAHTFNACDVDTGLGWQQTLEGLVNDLHLRYGIPEVEIHSTDDVSIDVRGTFEGSLTTAIANAVDAQTRSDEIVSRQARPGWILGGLQVALEWLPNPDVFPILFSFDMNDLIAVSELPPEGPATDTILWVEGWREVIEPESWIISYATSDYCRTAAAAHWDDIAQETTWDTVRSDMVWNRALCFPPSPSGGRWDDTLPTDRWDTIDNLLTWDNWGNGLKSEVKQ